jgi:hypothetical protein
MSKSLSKLLSQQYSIKSVSSFLNSPTVEFYCIENFFIYSFWKSSEESLEFLKFNEMAG